MMPAQNHDASIAAKPAVHAQSSKAIDDWAKEWEEYFRADASRVNGEVKALNRRIRRTLDSIEHATHL
jgi:hypothetical protein